MSRSKLDMTSVRSARAASIPEPATARRFEALIFE